MTETTTSIKVDLQSEISKEYDNIQIEIINLGDNYSVTALSDAHKEITVIAKGVESVINNIEGDEIKAQVDLSGFGPGTHEVPVILSSDDIRVSLIPKVSTVKVRIVSKSS